MSIQQYCNIGNTSLWYVFFVSCISEYSFSRIEIVFQRDMQSTLYLYTFNIRLIIYSKRISIWGENKFFDITYMQRYIGSSERKECHIAFKFMNNCPQVILVMNINNIEEVNLVHK